MESLPHSNPIGETGKAIPSKILRGRDKIPEAEAIYAQAKLAEFMTPEVLRQNFVEKEFDTTALTYTVDPLREAILLRFFGRYATDEYNGFTEYCNENENDTEFSNRVLSRSLTEKDLQAMKIYFEKHDGSFFTPQELTEFIDSNVNVH